MKKLKKRLAFMKQNFGVRLGEVAEETGDEGWSAFTIAIYLKEGRKLQPRTLNRFLREMNAALDRILESRAALILKGD